MRFTLRRATSASVLILGLLTACASTGDATIDPGDGGVGVAHDSASADVGSVYDSSSVYDSATTHDGGGGGACMANCTTDSECQNTCPMAPNGGTNCCDVGSGVCFASSSSTCPANGNDAGMD